MIGIFSSLLMEQPLYNQKKELEIILTKIRYDYVRIKNLALDNAIPNNLPFGNGIRQKIKLTLNKMIEEDNDIIILFWLSINNIWKLICKLVRKYKNEYE